MNNKRKMNLGLVVLSFVITTIAMILLPQSIPTHFGLLGVEKGPSYYLLSMPILALISWFATPYLIKEKENTPFKDKIYILVPIFVCINIVWIIKCFLLQ